MNNSLVSYPSYSVAIRTLGTGGDVYRRMIECLRRQTVQPEGIFVFIAEGYRIPDAIANERYVPCRKGMVSQRALTYSEISSEYILFLDDDLFLPDNAVQILFDALLNHKAECVAPNLFPNHAMPLKQKIKAALYSGTLPSLSGKYAFRIRLNACYSYAIRPKPVMLTQSFAGACILISKSAFISAHFEDERWLDRFKYPIGEDQILAYKLFTGGHRILVHYDTGIIHLDSRTGHGGNKNEKFYSLAFLRYVIWYRTILQRQPNYLGRLTAHLSCFLFFASQMLITIPYLLIGKDTFKPGALCKAVKDARAYVVSEEFQAIPKWV